MKKIYRYWTGGPVGQPAREGYSVADIIFTAAACKDFDTVWYGKERKTLNAAINDAKRYSKKNPDVFFSIYANATLTDYFDDGTMSGKPWEDCARIGTLDECGEYFDMCEPVDWLD